MNLPSPADINYSLSHLGNWRVLHVQEAMYPYKPFSASIMLSLGYRETGLRNICGGAILQNGKWVKSFTDRGWLQISAEISREATWLSSVEGCSDGYWTPSEPPVNALTPMHVPRFSPALDFTKQTMLADREFALRHGVPDAQATRFAIAAHNAGPTGALEGWREGDVDKHTAGGDYSAYVLAVAPMMHAWITTHPNWQYKR